MGQGAKKRHKSFVAQGFVGGCGTRTRGGSYDNKLRAHEKRIVEIEAKKRGVLADQEKHAVRITGDRVPNQGLPEGRRRAAGSEDYGRPVNAAPTSSSRTSPCRTWTAGR